VTRPHLRYRASLFPFRTSTLSHKWPENRVFWLQKAEKLPVPPDSGNCHTPLDLVVDRSASEGVWKITSLKRRDPTIAHDVHLATAPCSLY